MSVVLQTGVMYYRESQSDDWHPLILKVDTDLSVLIEDYSQKAWALGEYCRYDSAVYRCTTAITTPEVWDSTHWQETTIGEELKNLADITGDGNIDSGFTASDLTGAANELKTDVGDLEDITGDGSLSGFTATDLTGAANELKNTLNQLGDDVDAAELAINTIDTEINRNLLSNGTNLNSVIPTSSNSNVYAYGNNLGSMVNAPSGFASVPFAIDAVYNSYYIYQTLYVYPNASQKKPLIFQRAKYYLSGESIWSNWYNASPPVVQSGTESVTGNASDWVYKTITFPVPYYNTPMVTVSLYSVNYATDWTMPMIDQISNTGFRFGWYKMSGTKQVLWQAFGT